MNFKDFKKKYKEDPHIKKKVHIIIGAFLVVLLIIGVQLYTSNRDNTQNPNKPIASENVIGNYVKTDSTQDFIVDKPTAYSIDKEQNKAIEAPSIKADDNQISSMDFEDNSSVSTPSYSTPSYSSYDGGYTPPVREAPRRVISTPPVSPRAREVETPNYVSAPTRDITLPSSYTSSPQKPSTPSDNFTSDDNKPKDVGLSAEERLERSIRNKYKNGNSISGNRANSEVLAVIHNDQYVSSKKNTVRLRLLSPLYIGGNKIGTDAFITAYAQISGNQLQLSVRNIAYKGKQFPVNLIAYDARTGLPGIIITQDNILGDLEEKAQREIERSVGRGIIGDVVSQIFNGKNKTEARIQLFDEHRLILKDNSNIR